ncbi:ribonuclease III [candidate division WOR-1 bacterium RIFOXYB2_FULL_48_7]|uniref:Ribonuclease 3 n=1 Tax=candidate division WOR-1 bacterium RIFOXYB2_FULL_48_7 TaxID=1802583 RepID=A0A1F4TNG4_UNCSA|nr:MAG: ribonuclease III [candidate division WOR-1 bacterium RIFOXYB2_FULL_48_7]
MERLTPEREKVLQELENRLGISFLNKLLLNQSLTHSSYGHEKSIPDNERLEFLGDAVLKLVVSEYLYNRFPNSAEGDLTKIRAAAISDDTLAEEGQRFELGEYLLLSLNEKKGGGQKRRSNIANAAEALIGAIYLDAGIGKARDFVVELLRQQIDKVSREGYISDFKSALQEYAQKHKWDLPHYRVIKEVGPKHRRLFWMEVRLKGRRYGVGRGANKKETEQKAAAMALKRLEQEEKGTAKGLVPRTKKRLNLP